MCYGSKAAFTCALEAFGADHLVTGSDYPVLQDYEDYKETFAYIERLGLPGRMSTGSCTTMRRSCSASGTDAATLLGDHSRRSVEIECLNGHQDPRRIEADFARHENLCSNLVVCHARVANDALLFRPDDQVMLHRRQLEIRM